MTTERRAERRWKRDGSVNRVSLGKAAELIHGNPLNEKAPMTVEEATRRLLVGYKLETPLSWIYLI